MLLYRLLIRRPQPPSLRRRTVPEWRNRQTHLIQNQAPQGVRVQVPPPAPFISASPGVAILALEPPKTLTGSGSGEVETHPICGDHHLQQPRDTQRCPEKGPS
jgi:hypothetical protein